MDIERAATDGDERPPRRPKLGLEAATLPGDEDSPPNEEREGELDEVGQRADGTCRDGRPALAVVSVPGEVLGSGGGDADPRADPDRIHGDREECRLLADRVHEDRPFEVRGDGQRDARESSSAAEVEEGRDPGVDEDRQRGQAVDDVAEGDRRRIADRGQVDRGVPGEQEADVVVDRPPRVRREAQPERAQSGLEDGVIVGGEPREEIDARRERFARTVQALLLSVVPARAVRAPLPACSFIALPIETPGLP
jgi:hypothetical protein